ncbi:MAG: hypothetical protein EBU90_22395 [Proteobacteria bacterium]|nr:hypothetical protein [Pseudomonadota bacterium]NBP16226.1 hypothetical protein [bacterium]
MIGTFWIWYRSSFLNKNNLPMYSNIVKNEKLAFTKKAGTADVYKLQLSEQQLLTPTEISINDAGIVEGFIPSINDYVDIFYARGDWQHTTNPNTWQNIFSGRVAVQPYMQNFNSAIYEIQLIGNELLSSNKVIGNVIQDGVNFEKKTNKDIITSLLTSQRDALIKNTQYKVIFDESIKNKVIQTSGGVRANANQKVEGVLKDMLKANQLQLFINKENSGNSQTIKYHITDKYYNPDYLKPFFTLTQANCQIYPKIQAQPVKQANRFFYNAGTQTTLDIDAKALTNNAKVYYGDTFFNLSGIAGVISEEKIDNSFLEQETFNKVKKIRKGQQDLTFAETIREIGNKLAFNKVKNDLIEMSVIQLRIIVNDFEIPKDLHTRDGRLFWKQLPATLDTGMRFTLNLQNFNYSQEMLITAINGDIGDTLNIIIECVPVEVLDAKMERFTLPNLRNKFKAENGGREPTALEMMQYIYKNPTEPEARFQLGLLNPLQYGSLTQNTKLINTTRILTI